MKKKFYLKGLSGLAIIGLLVGGCSKEEVPGTGDFEMLSFNSEEVLDMLPSGLTKSTDPYAQTCVTYITTAVDMSGFISFMEVPADAQRSTKNISSQGDTWQWSSGYGGLNFTMFWTFDEDDSKRYWSLDISYNDGPVFDYIDAWEYKDGSGGEVLYNFNWASMYDSGMEGETETEMLYWKYNWSKNGAGDYTIDWYWESDSDEYDHVAGYNIIIKADGSGTLDSILEDSKVYEMIWDALGNGSWIMGDGQDSGSWVAG